MFVHHSIVDEPQSGEFNIYGLIVTATVRISDVNQKGMYP